MPRGRPTTAKRRREVLAAFRRSGLSLQRFAARAGIPYSTLAHWRSKERREVVPSFVAVEVAPAVETVTALEVRVGDAVVVVPPAFDEEHLRLVVRALGAC